MSDLPPYAARFSYGRLFADCGRVLARAWLPLAIGVVVLGVAPTVVAALPWWRGAANTPGLQRYWLAITTAETLVGLIANSARVAFIAGVALKVLTGQAWREMLQVRRLATGFTTALCVNLLVNWPALANPVFRVLQPYGLLIGFALGLAAPACLLLSVPFVGIAVSAAVSETRWVGPAAARSFRLLRGLRWRMVAFAFGYLICLGLSEFGTALVLAIARVPYNVPGLGLAAVSLGPLLLGPLFDMSFVSFFLQARRIADGPSASELHEVFA